MFAIVEACGRQYKLEPGRFVDIDFTSEPNGENHLFDKVLMLVDGDETTVGQPFVEGAIVTGKVISDVVENEVHGRMESTLKSAKVIVYHMKPKKGTRKKQGHRQQFTRVYIDSIEVNKKVVAKAEPKQRAESKS
jgi:large subunit ribosomal protein L21